MEPGVHQGRQEFRASWRSSIAVLAIVLILMAVGCTVAAVAAASHGGWAFGALALFFVLMAWLLLLPFLSRHPVLQVDARGIGGFQLRGHTVPWAEIANVDHLTIQGQDQIQLTLKEGAPSLAATRRWFSARSLRAIPLASLRRADRPLATQAALQAFYRYAGAQAEVAMNQRLDELVAEEAFEERLRVLTPTPWALYAVIVVNVAVWLLNLLDGMSPTKPTPAELFAWGANSSTAVVRDGEHWRLLTATVLHGGVLHLGLNMFALWDAGRRVCRWFGNGQFLLIYLAAGLAGSALSLHFSSQQAVSVGASGAVFGVLGALLVGVYQHRDSVPKAMATQLLTSQGVFVALMLVQGFARSGIDNAAHVGGLVVGALTAWLLVELVDERATQGLRRSRQVLAAGTAAVVVGLLVATASSGVDHRQLFGVQDRLTQLLPRLQAAEAALQQDAKDQKDGRMSEAQWIEAMAQRHIPTYRAMQAELVELGPLSGVGRMAEFREFHAMVLEVMTLEVGKARGTVDATRAEQRLKELSADMIRVGERLRSKDEPPTTP